MLTQLATFAPSYEHLPPTPCFVQRVYKPNPLFLQRGDSSSLFCVYKSTFSLHRSGTLRLRTHCTGKTLAAGLFFSRKNREKYLNLACKIFYSVTSIQAKRREISNNVSLIARCFTNRPLGNFSTKCFEGF